MVTAWSPFRAPRARTYAGPSRLLWLAVLLFSLVLTHGLSTESAEGHSAPGTAAAAPAAVAHAHAAADAAPSMAAVTAVPADAHDHDHGPDPAPDTDPGPDSDPDHGPEHDSRHAGDECVSGQPQHGPALDSPCLAPCTWDSGCDRAAGKRCVPGAEPAVIPLAASRRSVVRQV